MIQSIRLSLANRLLPRGHRIALPGFRIVPNDSEDQDAEGMPRFIRIEVVGEYLRDGQDYYCPAHRWSFTVFKWEARPVCPRCKVAAFERAAEVVKDEPRVPSVTAAEYLRRRIDEGRG